jgi:hypothetical protein
MHGLQKLDTWHQTKTGLITFAVIELGLSYVFASLAIGTGSLWFYTLTLLMVVGALRNLYLLLGRLLAGRKKEV